MLITGATGALGSALIPALFNGGNFRVILIVRARNEDEMRFKRERLLNWWGWRPGGLEDERILFIKGDVSKEGLDLEDSSQNLIDRDVTEIVHCAASVKMNMSLDLARHSCVLPTNNIIKLARTLHLRGQLRKLVYISTVGVGGRFTNALPEKWVEYFSDESYYHNTYERAKAESETEIRIAWQQEGIPAIVLRPSMVIGSEGSGKILNYGLFYHICAFLVGFHTKGLMVPLENSALDVIPANRVAAAIRASLDDLASVSGVYNICSGRGREIPLVTLQSLARRILSNNCTSLPRFFTIPRGLFSMGMSILSNIPIENCRRLSFISRAYMDYLNVPQVFLNDRYHDLLRSMGELPFDPFSTIESSIMRWTEECIPPSTHRISSLAK